MICKCGHPEERHANGPCKACVSRCKAFTSVDNLETLRKKNAELENEVKIKESILDNATSVNQTGYSATSSSAISFLFGSLGVLITIGVFALLVVPVILSISPKASSSFNVPDFAIASMFAFIGVMVITGNSFNRMMRLYNLGLVGITAMVFMTIFPGLSVTLPVAATNVSFEGNFTIRNDTNYVNITRTYENLTLGDLTVVVGNWSSNAFIYSYLKESDFCPNGTRFVPTECECARKAREENRSTTCLVLCGRCI